MRPNKMHVQHLIQQKGWSQAKFARKMEMSCSTVCRYLNGERQAGPQFNGNLLRLFPNEPIERLFILPQNHALVKDNRMEEVADESNC